MRNSEREIYIHSRESEEKRAENTPMGICVELYACVVCVVI